MIWVAPMKGEDESFIALVNRITGEVVRGTRPVHVVLTRIDHWFDVKWLRFSGNILGRIPIHNKRLTLPPFRPERVVSQTAYSFDDPTGCYLPIEAALFCRWQASGENLTRFIDRISSDGLFIWFSGSTQGGLGCMMVYSTSGNGANSWYASFRLGDAWRPCWVRGISRAELQYLMEDSSPVGVGEKPGIESQDRAQQSFAPPISPSWRRAECF